MKKTVLLLLLFLPAAGGCRSAIETRARRLIEPSAVLWAAVTEPPGAGPLLKLLGRIDKTRRIPSTDGTKIDLWVISSRTQAGEGKGDGGARGTVVVLHPLLVGKSWFLNVGAILSRRGWDVVLMDLRAHGWSEGSYITWGAKEKHDVKAVMDDLLGDGTVRGPVYALGSSFGAGVAVQYAAIDPRCRGVMAIAPPQSCREITRRMLPLESKAEYEAALALAGKIADFNPDEASAEQAAAHLKCPLILVHGYLDLIVPYRHGQAVYRAAAEPKKMITLWRDGHASEIARDEWIADRIDELAAMSAGSSPSTQPTASSPRETTTGPELM